MTMIERMAMPEIVYQPAPCPKCGARTEAEAASLCRPTTDQTGEEECPGGEPDDLGRIVQPTPESIAALDDWCDAQGRADSLPLDGGR